MKILRRILGALLLLVGILALGLWLKPPALLRVGANYTAKIVCSNVFMAGRDPEAVLRIDVQAPGISLLKAMRVSVDREQGIVRAGFLGFIGNGLATYRDGKGCTVLPDGRVEQQSPQSAARTTRLSLPGRSLGTLSATDLWPVGAHVVTNSAIDQILTDPKIAGPGVRAIVVVDHGHIVGERYATGFGPTTPLLGWSMTKTVMAGVIGMLIKDGKLSLDQAGFWSGTDGRERIQLKDL